LADHALDPSVVRRGRLPRGIAFISQAILLGIGVISTVVSLAGEWFHGRDVLGEWLLTHVSTLGALLHVTLITLVLFPGRIQPLNSAVNDASIRATIQCLNSYFLGAWQWFWWFLGMFYVTMLFRIVVATHPHGPVLLTESHSVASQLPSALMDLFSVGSTTALVAMTRSLTPSFIRTCTEALKGATPEMNDRHPLQWRRWPHITRWVILGAGFGITVFCARLGAYGMAAYADVDRISSLVTGLASAIALGYFVGRVDSMFLSRWQWLIPLLFLYAAIQVYSSVLYEPDIARLAVLVYGAFTMKCMLFIFISLAYASRRLLYYAAEVVEGAERGV